MDQKRREPSDWFLCISQPVNSQSHNRRSCVSRTYSSQVPLMIEEMIASSQRESGTAEAPARSFQVLQESLFIVAISSMSDLRANPPTATVKLHKLFDNEKISYASPCIKHF